MGRIRVLHYAPLFLPTLGGTELNTYWFARYSKHRHYILTDSLPSVPCVEELDGIKVYRIGPPRVEFELSRVNLVLEFLLGTIREMNRAIKLHRIDFDVMHLHGSSGFTVLFDTIDRFLGFSAFKKLLAWRTCKRPIVVTAHTMPSLRNRFISNSFLAQRERRSWITLEMLYRSEADVVICVDKYMTASMNNFPGKAKVVYIPSGIDTNLFKPVGKEEAHRLLPIEMWNKIAKYADNFLVLYVGRIDHAKGGQLLGNFARKLPNDVKLIIAGYGDLHLLGRADNMIYVGRIENHCVPALINSCDVIFNPVLVPGTSRGTFEGMACGKPVIMFGNPTDRFPMVHRTNGFLVSSIDEAVETVIRLRNDSALYSRVSCEAIKTARENSVPSLAKRVDEIYETLVKCRLPRNKNSRI